MSFGGDSDKIVQQISEAIQAVYSEAACCSDCDNHVLDKSNKRVRDLCRLLNVLFSHGLTNPDEGYWPLVREIVSRREAAEVLEIWQPKTNKGKGMAWLYNSLNEGTLEYGVGSLVNNHFIVDKYYGGNAYLLNKQVIEKVTMFLRGLDGVKIYLEPRNAQLAKPKGDSTTTTCCTVAANRKQSMNNRLSNKDVIVVTQSRTNFIASNRKSSLAMLEESVADFSDCPEVLGISNYDRDLLISSAEACSDALEFDFPVEFYRPWSKSVMLQNLAPKKRVTLSKSVPKIDENGPDLGAVPQSSLETSNNFMCVPPPTEYDANDVASSTPISRNDAELMLNEILKGRRRPTFGPSETPTLKSSATLLDPTVNLDSFPAILDDLNRSTTFASAKDQLIDTDQSINNKNNNNQPDLISQITIDINNSSRAANELKPFNDGLLTSYDLNNDVTCNGSINFRRPIPIDDVENPDKSYSEFERRLFNRLDQVYESTMKKTPSSGGDSLSSKVRYATAPRDAAPQPAATLGAEAAAGGNDDDYDDERRSSASSASKLLIADVGLTLGGGDASSSSANLDDGSGGDAVARKIRRSQFSTGEILLESVEILELTTNVMQEGEQYYKMFRVFLNHRLGNALIRYLLLSNKCLYLLIAKPISAEDSVSSGKKDNGLGSFLGHFYYVIDIRMPFDRIDYISVGLNGQYFNLHLRQKRQCIAICTASDCITRSILSHLDISIRRMGNAPLPSVYTESKPQSVCLKKWILGETGTDEHRICTYNLIYWNPNLCRSKFGPLSSSGSTNRNGYLYGREFYPSGWIRKSTEWQQSYFILQGKKFYEFEDMSCKVGRRVYDLENEVTGCRQTETSEHTYCIELYCQDPSTVIQLACPTKHELQQWLCAFYNSFSSADTAPLSCTCLACCLVLTDNYLLIGQETTAIGFIRTLALSRLVALTEFRIIRKFNCLIMTVESSNSSQNDECWLLCFVHVTELDNFLAVLEKLVDNFTFEELADDCPQSPFAGECYSHWMVTKSD